MTAIYCLFFAWLYRVFFCICRPMPTDSITAVIDRPALEHAVAEMAVALDDGPPVPGVSEDAVYALATFHEALDWERIVRLKGASTQLLAMHLPPFNLETISREADGSVSVDVVNALDHVQQTLRRAFDQVAAAGEGYIHPCVRA